MTVFLLNGRNDPEREIDVVSDTVAHQLKLAIWRDEGNCSIGVEFSKTHTSMESAVINLNTRLALSGFLTINNKLVVQSKLALRHSRQFGVHLYLPRDFVSQDAASAGEQQVDALEDVNVHFIPLMLDSFSPPVDSSGDLTRQLRRLRFILRPNVAKIDVETQDVNGTILWVSKVHCLIHQLVDESHVVTHGVLVKLFSQVGLEDANLLKQVFKDQSWVDIRSGQSNKVHVQVAGVQKGAVLNTLDRGLRSSLFRSDDLSMNKGDDGEFFSWEGDISYFNVCRRNIHRRIWHDGSQWQKAAHLKTERISCSAAHIISVTKSVIRS